jgi:hypothetical protein
MAGSSPKLLQQVFEVRYERGYRYLDRCGDAMVILEEALPSISDSKVWMPEDAQPQGARMKCPDLDLTLVFDAGRLCLEQNPAEKACPFGNICEYALGTIKSKFDVGEITRFGHRRMCIVPTDSVEKAEELSVKYAAKSNLECVSDGMEASSYEAAITKETADKSQGIRLGVKPVQQLNAPLKIDARLQKRPHMLERGQREALLGQLRRAKQRETNPLAGLLIDIDCWSLYPSDLTVDGFLQEADSQIKEITSSFLEGLK